MGGRKGDEQIPTIAQRVERRTVELRGYPSVAGSIPACRSFYYINHSLNTAFLPPLSSPCSLVPFSWLRLSCPFPSSTLSMMEYCSRILRISLSHSLNKFSFASSFFFISATSRLDWCLSRSSSSWSLRLASSRCRAYSWMFYWFLL